MDRRKPLWKVDIKKLWRKKEKQTFVIKRGSRANVSTIFIQ